MLTFIYHLFFLLTNTINEESQLTSILFAFGAHRSLWWGCRTVKHNAEAEQEASLLSGAGKCFSARVWNTHLQTWGRKMCKKMSSICRGLDKMANILHAIFSKASSWQKFNIFWLKYQWNLSLRVYLITNHQWLRQLFGAEQVISRYLNQWWPLIWWMASAPGNILYNEIENYLFKIIATSPRGQ